MSCEERIMPGLDRAIRKRFGRSDTCLLACCVRRWSRNGSLSAATSCSRAPSSLVRLAHCVCCGQAPTAGQHLQSADTERLACHGVAKPRWKDQGATPGRRITSARLA